MQTSITAQGGLLQVKIPSEKQERAIGARRKPIKRFTRASKKRLLDKFATLHLTKRSKIIFITLTYGQEYPSFERSKEHLEALFKRFDRRYKNWSGFWRLEEQERGAPHYHLLLFNMPFIAHDVLSELWAQVIGIEYCSNFESFGSDYIEGKQSEYPDGNVNDFPMVDIELVKGKAKAMGYVAKYIAKGNTVEYAPTGASSFNFAAYPAAPAAGAGRYWGIAHEDRLPTSPAYAFTIELSPGDWKEFAAAAEAHYPRLFTKIIDGQEYRIEGSFTLYVGNALEWVELIYLIKMGLVASVATD